MSDYFVRLALRAAGTPMRYEPSHAIDSDEPAAPIEAAVVASRESRVGEQVALGAPPIAPKLPTPLEPAARVPEPIPAEPPMERRLPAGRSAGILPAGAAEAAEAPPSATPPTPDAQRLSVPSQPQPQTAPQSPQPPPPPQAPPHPEIHLPTITPRLPAPTLAGERVAQTLLSAPIPQTRVSAAHDTPQAAVVLQPQAATAAAEPTIEVHIGRLELHQPPPRPPAQPAPAHPTPSAQPAAAPATPARPSGFEGYERARTYRDRDWY